MSRLETRDGKKWDLTLTVGHLKPLRENHDVRPDELLDETSGKLKALLTDPERFVDVLHLLCRAECEKAEVSAQQFGESFDGQALEAAATAFLECLLDFSLRSKASEKMKAGLRPMLDRLDRETGEKIDQAFARIASKPSASNSVEPSR